MSASVSYSRILGMNGRRFDENKSGTEFNSKHDGRVSSRMRGLISPVFGSPTYNRSSSMNTESNTQLSHSEPIDDTNQDLNSSKRSSSSTKSTSQRISNILIKSPTKMPRGKSSKRSSETESQQPTNTQLESPKNSHSLQLSPSQTIPYSSHTSSRLTSQNYSTTSATNAYPPRASQRGILRASANLKPPRINSEHLSPALVSLYEELSGDELTDAVYCQTAVESPLIPSDASKFVKVSRSTGPSPRPGGGGDESVNYVVNEGFGRSESLGSSKSKRLSMALKSVASRLEEYRDYKRNTKRNSTQLSVKQRLAAWEQAQNEEEEREFNEILATPVVYAETQQVVANEEQQKQQQPRGGVNFGEEMNSKSPGSGTTSPIMLGLPEHQPGFEVVSNSGREFGIEIDRRTRSDVGRVTTNARRSSTMENAVASNVMKTRAVSDARAMSNVSNSNGSRASQRVVFDGKVKVKRFSGTDEIPRVKVPQKQSNNQGNEKSQKIIQDRQNSLLA
mmetsp:Transcript_1218/g.2249  ORF Transcript_1218/g.2249 Transcript_1218/m.2249 type:complete len:507 (-) Transcript_1218:579-2099(-)|eukprot:CAMPEP_0182444258 /NCGR_PEP_ID=MMETSP1172-20130603/2770_1 /TAXON_ID=708627 /ORGANISM="Timspurckia oligopyrenoides, Strain CCMP3278" /LENGTH=506 /DNA_ID=CAMNT_0024639779 /DNA_START=144 /DNA_END=1664 /DNA_ORIENTATION=+